MCLVTKNKEGLVSDKPVVCYKLYCKDKEDRFVSPFQGSCYELKEGDEVIAEGPKEINKNPCEGCYDLGPGFIHATTERWMPVYVNGNAYCLISNVFTNFLTWNKSEQDIDKELDEIIKFLERYERLCEMEIPAGERYWVEEDMLLFQRGICSSKMVFRGEYKITKKSELLSIGIKMIIDETKREKIQSLIEKYEAKGE